MFLEDKVVARMTLWDNDTQEGICCQKRRLVSWLVSPQDSKTQHHIDLSLRLDVQARSNDQLCTVYNQFVKLICRRYQVQRFQLDRLWQQRRLAHSKILLQDIHQTILDYCQGHPGEFLSWLLSGRSTLHRTGQLQLSRLQSHSSAQLDRMCIHFLL